MTRNTLLDLNNHLFAQLERLGDEGLSPDEMKAEIERARAVTGVAQQVISNANVVLRTAEFRDAATGDARVPRMLGGTE